MSKLFRSRPSKAAPAPHHRNESHHHQHPDDLTSQYSSLLDPVLTIHHEQPVHSSGTATRSSTTHRRAKSSPGAGWSHAFSSTTPDLSLSSRPWLAAAESRPSWDRPPARKLVKEPNGSGRPSFSIELSDSEGEGGGKGLLRRQLRRLRELYHRGEK